MKRWLLRILLCLILGAISTVAVAWGLIIHWDMQLAEMPDAVLPSVSPATAVSEFVNDPEAYVVQQNSAAVFIRIRLEYFLFHKANDGPYVIQRLVGGVPFRALGGATFHRIRPPDETRRPWLLTISKDSNSWLGYIYGHRVLPLRPIWPGFVIDTLFYGVIWFGVPFGFTSAKRFIRIKRGRCPRCGYDLRGNLEAGCSECGWNRETASS